MAGGRELQTGKAVVRSVPASRARGDAVGGRRHRVRRGRRAPGMNDGACVCVSQCVCEFIELALDPFRTPRDVQIPMPPSMPSTGVTTFNRGVFASGTSSGFGFVMTSPNAHVTSDSTSIWRSTGAYAGFVLTNSVIPGIELAVSNSPYLTAEFDELSLEWRLAAYGLRVRYTGTEMTRAGRLTLLSEPARASVVSMTFDDLRAYDEAADYPVDRKWRSVVALPVRERDYHYSDQDPSSIDPHFVTAAVSVPTGTSLTFEYESFAHFELIGPKARGKQVRVADPVGGPAAIGTLQTMQSTNKPVSVAEAIKDTAQSIAASTSSMVSLGRMAKSAFDAVSAAYNAGFGGEVTSVAPLMLEL